MVVARPGSTKVFGRILDPQNQPIVGARVWMRDWDMANGRQVSGSVVEVLSGRDGRYCFTSVDPGGHYLQVYVKGRRSVGGSEPFEVKSGAEVEKKLKVKVPSPR